MCLSRLSKARRSQQSAKTNPLTSPKQSNADLAGELRHVLADPTGPGPVARQRRGYGRRVATEAVHPLRDLLYAAQQYRVPAVRSGHGLEPRLQDRQGGLFGGQHGHGRA